MAAPQILDNISELSTLLKTVYGPQVEQQQNLAAMAYKKFSTSKIEFGGNSYEFPARMENAQSVGARGYRTQLPEPIANIDVTARVRQKFVYSTFDIAGPDIEKGKGNANAFVNTLTDKMTSITDSTLKDLNMQTYLDGTGVRATISVVTGTVLTVDVIKYLRVGMQVNVIAADGVTIRGGNGESDPGDAGIYALKRFTILNITAGANPTVTLGVAGVATLPTGTIATDVIVRHKTVGAQLIGFDAIVDDGINNPAANILQDIDRTANVRWRAKVVDLGGADLSLQAMQSTMDAVEVSSGRRVDMLLGSYNGRDRYLQLLVPQKRFTDLKMDGGFQTLEYNGRDFMVDVDCQDDTVYFLSKSSIQRYNLFDLQFVEQTGGILKHDSLASGDVFYGFQRFIGNFGTTQANANAKITNMVVSSDYILYQ